LVSQVDCSKTLTLPRHGPGFVALPNGVDSEAIARSRTVASSVTRPDLGTPKPPFDWRSPLCATAFFLPTSQTETAGRIRPSIGWPLTFSASVASPSSGHGLRVPLCVAFPQTKRPPSCPGENVDVRAVQVHTPRKRRNRPSVHCDKAARTCSGADVSES